MFVECQDALSFVDSAFSFILFFSLSFARLTVLMLALDAPVFLLFTGQKISQIGSVVFFFLCV